MDFEAVRAGLQSAVPFNLHVGVEIAEVGPGVGVVVLPDRAETRNHIASQHAGALFTAGEAASGAAFIGAFAEQMGELTPLAEKAEISYVAIARGRITATGRLGVERGEILAALEADGRARFPVEVELADESGTPVARMTVQWYVRRRRA